MGKDDPKVQNAIDSGYNSAFTGTQQLQGQNGSWGNQLQEPYYQGTARDLNDYDSVMNSYRSFLGQPPAGSMNYTPNDPGSNLRNSLSRGDGSSSGSSGGGGGLDYFNSKYPEGGTLSPQMLLADEADLKAHGISLIKNAAGQPGKISIDGSGAAYDVIQGAGNGTNKSQRIPLNAAAGGSSNGNSGSMGDFGALGPGISGYMDFAQNGGFSPQDISDIRARNIASTRGIYQNAQDELGRSKNLSGGYAPNFAAAQARLTRNSSNQIADINRASSADIAQMVNSGRQFGIQGLTNTGLTGRNQALQGMSGMSSLYGTTPAFANTFGNQVLQSQGIQSNNQGMYNDLVNNRVRGQLGLSAIPSAWTTGANNFGTIAKGVGDIGGAMAGF